MPKGKGRILYHGYYSPEPGRLSAHDKKVLSHAYSSCRHQYSSEHNKENKQRCAKIAWSAVNKSQKSNNSY